MRLYKLTDQRFQSYNNTQWGEGVRHTASGKGPLCGSGWIHAYTDPLLAVLLNPGHANYRDPLLWEAEGEVEKEEYGLKMGVTSLLTIHRLPLPEISTDQKVRFAILCALAVYDAPEFVKWAQGWLSGRDRSVKAAWVEAKVATAEEEMRIWALQPKVATGSWAAAAGACAAEAGACAAEVGTWVEEQAAVWVARATLNAAFASAKVMAKPLALAALAARAVEAGRTGAERDPPPSSLPPS